MNNNDLALYAYLNDTLSRWFFPLLSNGIKILDFGCGNGFLTDCIQKSFYNAQVIGIDIDAQQIEKNKEYYPAVDFQLVTSLSLPFDENSIDLIYTVNVFHHIVCEEQKKYAVELLRIMKANGTFIIFEANPYNLSSRRIFYKEHSKETAMLNVSEIKSLFYKSKCSIKQNYLYPNFSRNFELLLKYVSLGPLYAVIITKK
jgi:ubiquinone/menaquinone biosynthesis C-methylase UbiE